MPSTEMRSYSSSRKKATALSEKEAPSCFEESVGPLPDNSMPVILYDFDNSSLEVLSIYNKNLRNQTCFAWTVLELLGTPASRPETMKNAVHAPIKKQEYV